MSAKLPSSIRGMPHELPARIGSYPVRGVIGTGSMGVVYLGHDPVIDRPVAIKTIQRHLLEVNARQHDAAARFRIEAQAAGRLNHRNIVAVYQFGEDQDCAYIVMEYVAGHSLSDYLRPPEHLAKGEVLSLMLQLLDALHYAHESGVVHRDIKPANLMVDREGRLKITDFGVARTESSQVTRANAMVGSPGYMAPEQYTGGPLDRRVDVFAAGVLLYKMVTGSLPYTGSDDAIMYQIVYGQHVSVVTRTGDTRLAPYDAIIERALAKTPEQRFATAWEFREALQTLAGGPVSERLAPDRLIPLRAPVVDTKALSSRVPASGASRPTYASVPVPTGWDETQLTSLERELAQHVGPVARVLVRRAARGQTDLSLVRHLVASAIVDVDVREHFLASTAGFAGPDSKLPSGLPSVFADTRPTTPHGQSRLTPQDVEKAEAVLARTLGPIAKVLVKRCAEGASTREQFVARVLEQITARVDAHRLESELWRSMV
jgi:eukaryotic-like serine/threonine-protein kinase